MIVLEEDTKATNTVAITPRPLIRNASLLKSNDWYSDNTPRTLLLCVSVLEPLGGRPIAMRV